MRHEYTVAVNGEIEPDLVLTSKREARQTVSDWKSLSKGQGYKDRFQIMVREVGPWRKLDSETMSWCFSSEKGGDVDER